MKNKMESNIASAENKFLYLVIGAVVIDWDKVMIDKFYKE